MRRVALVPFALYWDLLGHSLRQRGLPIRRYQCPAMIPRDRDLTQTHFQREREREGERERRERESARWHAHEREAAAAACTRACKIVRQCTGGAVRAASTFFSSCVSTRCRWSEGTEAWQHWLTPQWPAFTVRCTPRFRSPRLSAWQWGGNDIADRSVHRTIDWCMV